MHPSQTVLAHCFADSACDEDVLARFRQVIRGRSYSEVSALTGIHPETCRRCLIDGRLTLKLLIPFCNATGVSFQWLLSGVGLPTADSGGAEWLASVDRVELAREVARRWMSMQESLIEAHRRLDRLECAAAAA